MLLKLGTWMMAAALAIAAGVVLVVLFRTSEMPAGADPASVAQETTAAPRGFDSYEEFDRPEPKAAPKREVVPERQTLPEREAPPAEREVPPEREAAPLQNALVDGEEDFPVPEKAEVARLEEPRRFAPDRDASLALTLPSLGIWNAPVYDSDSSRALEAGVGHVPETSMPWDGGAQRNVYLAAHRLGYPGSGSRLLFYELDQLGRGDEVVLKGKGETYRYKVTEVFVVDPNDSWVMGQMVGRDMVTLQTCTPIPTFEKRLIVRAEKV